VGERRVSLKENLGAIPGRMVYAFWLSINRLTNIKTLLVKTHKQNPQESQFLLSGKLQFN
jgi:hypothetical protein